MRWHKDPLPKHVGETRIIKKFLFSPYEINREIRWLERVQIEQVGDTLHYCGLPYLGWRDVRFVDEGDMAHKTYAPPPPPPLDYRITSKIGGSEKRVPPPAKSGGTNPATDIYIHFKKSTTSSRKRRRWPVK